MGKGLRSKFAKLLALFPFKNPIFAAVKLNEAIRLRCSNALPGAQLSKPKSKPVNTSRSYHQNLRATDHTQPSRF